MSHGVEDTRPALTLAPVLSENATGLLAEEFGIQPIDTVETDEEAILDAT